MGDIVTTPEPSVDPKPAIAMRRQLEELQSDEHRRVLDLIPLLRKCGLDTILSLPQIVVCGDQSSGKSSVLEALTEISFPRADNLCTRFATEISLRRDPVASLTVKVIPDSTRSAEEQMQIKEFSETITDFSDLPDIMENAKAVMGINEIGNAFSKDILSIDIAGPDRPHLTLVDIPGLIQSSTKGVSKADVQMVADITNHYIEQPRTICLAIISATNDAANQSILDRVRKFDPEGERTLGVITKPDKLEDGSGSEAKFIELARNEDVFFKLGWHVVKNRTFNESGFSIIERNASEALFFRYSNFRQLPRESLGIDALRVRLSHLLLEHVKSEVPRLKSDLENALQGNREELKKLGCSRASLTECRTFLADLNMTFFDLCKAGLGGHYDQEYFQMVFADLVVDHEKVPANRLRALVQNCNKGFADVLRKKGHKFQLLLSRDGELAEAPEDTATRHSKTEPIALPKDKALSWARNVLRRCRGTELVGNFNPSVIAELFWEQSERWERLAKQHIEDVAGICDRFLRDLLNARAPHDMRQKLWTALVQSEARARREAAHQELDKLLRDRRDFPINYNHIYTDTITTKRRNRFHKQLSQQYEKKVNVDGYPNSSNYKSIFNKAVDDWGISHAVDMEVFSCEEALDCLLAIYKVQQKTFVANVVTQVIERHIVRDIHVIFSPMVALNIPDEKLDGLVGEPPGAKRQRAFLMDRLKKLEDGKEVFQSIMGF